VKEAFSYMAQFLKKLRHSVVPIFHSQEKFLEARTQLLQERIFVDQVVQYVSPATPGQVPQSSNAFSPLNMEYFNGPAFLQIPQLTAIEK
jgi:hypothetical protein